jgi:hypothetical protein
MDNSFGMKKASRMVSTFNFNTRSFFCFGLERLTSYDSHYIHYGEKMSLPVI